MSFSIPETKYMYKIERVETGSKRTYQIVKNNKPLKTFEFREDAENEIARYIEDDQWNAANRD